MTISMPGQCQPGWLQMFFRLSVANFVVSVSSYRNILTELPIDSDYCIIVGICWVSPRWWVQWAQWGQHAVSSIWSGNIPSRWRAETWTPRSRSRDIGTLAAAQCRVLGSILRPPGLPPYTDAITPAQRGTAQDPIQVSQNSRISILNNFPPLSVARIHDPWWYNYIAGHCQVSPTPTTHLLASAHRSLRGGTWLSPHISYYILILGKIWHLSKLQERASW